MPGPSTDTRLQALDALRGAAVALVLLRHVPLRGHEAVEYLPAWLQFFRRGGWAGVDLFFVLSGFLIAGLLFREYARHGSISFRRFFVRRGFKIYPAYYVMVAITLPFAALSPWVRPDGIWEGLWPWLVYAQNYFFTRSGHLWAQTWSLAIEEQFYVLLPVLLIFLSRASKNRQNPFRAVPPLFLLIGGACLWMRFHLHSPENRIFLTHMIPFHLRADSLFFGVFLSYLYHFHAESFRRAAAKHCRFFAAAGLALFLPAFLWDLKDPFIYTFGFTLLYAGSGLVIVSALGGAPSRNRFARALAFVGAHSYSIYLWHFVIAKALEHWIWRLPGQAAWYAAVLSYLVLSLWFGIKMSQWVETPFLKLRERLYPSRSGNPVI